MAARRRVTTGSPAWRRIMALAAGMLLPGIAASQACSGFTMLADGFEAPGGPEPVGASQTPYRHVTPTDVGTRISVGVVGPVPSEPYAGDNDIDTPGATIENVVIDSCLRISADDVTVRNVIIDCGGLYPVKIEDGSRNVRIEYSRVICGSSSKVFYFESGAPHAAVTHNEISGCSDFFYLHGDLDGVAITDNWMHTLIGPGDAHADGFQVGEASTATGHIHLRGNYIDPDNASIGKNDIIFGTNFSQVHLLIEDNYFEPWGHYTMRCGGEATRCTIRNNIYGPEFQGVEQHLLLANASSPPAPPDFCCNRYADQSMLEEYFGNVDLVHGTEHMTTGCRLPYER